MRLLKVSSFTSAIFGTWYPIPQDGIFYRSNALEQYMAGNVNPDLKVNFITLDYGRLVGLKLCFNFRLTMLHL